MKKYRHEGAHGVESAANLDKLLDATTKETLHGKVGNTSPDRIMGKITKKGK